MTTKPDWQELFKVAVLETDWSRIEERNGAAESAIQERKHEFSLNHGGAPEERQAIANALNSLGVLRADAASRREPERAS